MRYNRGRDPMEGAAMAIVTGWMAAPVLTGGGGADAFILRAGETQGGRITGFARPDVIRLPGFGAGATLTEIGPATCRLPNNGAFFAPARPVAGIDMVCA
jgi:hypothetical protein